MPKFLLKVQYQAEGVRGVMKVGGTEDSLERDAGQVTRSDPEASATANQGDTVTIWTATGNVAVPNVEGQSKKDAKKTLEAAGLTAEVTEVLPDGNRLVRFRYEGVFLEVLERLGR